MLYVCLCFSLCLSGPRTHVSSCSTSADTATASRHGHHHIKKRKGQEARKRGRGAERRGREEGSKGGRKEGRKRKRGREEERKRGGEEERKRGIRVKVGPGLFMSQLGEAEGLPIAPPADVVGYLQRVAQHWQRPCQSHACGHTPTHQHLQAVHFRGGEGPICIEQGFWGRATQPAGPRRHCFSDTCVSAARWSRT